MYPARAPALDGSEPVRLLSPDPEIRSAHDMRKPAQERPTPVAWHKMTSDERAAVERPYYEKEDVRPTGVNRPPGLGNNPGHALPTGFHEQSGFPSLKRSSEHFQNEPRSNVPKKVTLATASNGSTSAPAQASPAATISPARGCGIWVVTWHRHGQWVDTVLQMKGAYADVREANLAARQLYDQEFGWVDDPWAVNCEGCLNQKTLRVSATGEHSYSMDEEDGETEVAVSKLKVM